MHRDPATLPELVEALLDDAAAAVARPLPVTKSIGCHGACGGERCDRRAPANTRSSEATTPPIPVV